MNFYPENRAAYDNTAHAGYLRLQTHTKGMQYLLLLDGSSVYADGRPCYVVL
jgi:hypothetical protein